MPIVDLAKYRNSPRVEHDMITVRPDGSLTLGKNVYEAMGPPAEVSVVLDTDAGQVVIGGVDKGDGFRVGKALQVNLARAMRQAGWRVTDRRQAQPTKNDQGEWTVTGVTFERRPTYEK